MNETSPEIDEGQKQKETENPAVSFLETIAEKWDSLSPRGKTLATGLVILAGFQGADLLTTQLALQAGSVEVGPVANLVKQVGLGLAGDIGAKTLLYLGMAGGAIAMYKIENNMPERQFLFDSINTLRGVNIWFAIVSTINLAGAYVSHLITQMPGK